MRRLEHIGIAVDHPTEAVRILSEVLGRAPYKSESVEAEGVATHFISAGTAKIEMLEALGPDSPIAGFLEKRGPGIHHLAFEVDDLDAEVARLERLGYRALGKPRGGADGKQIVFLHPRETARVLIELCRQTSYPETLAAAAEIVVAPGPASDPLAHALARRHGVRRDGLAAFWAAVDPGDWAPPANAVGVCVGTQPGRVEASLVIGIDRPGDVMIPRHLWEQLPDPWGTIADLAGAHFASVKAQGLDQAGVSGSTA